MSRKDYSIGMYGSVIFLLLIAMGGVVWMGESWSFWKARQYLKKHRKVSEPLLSDASMFWKKVKFPNAQILRPGRSYPSSFWKLGRDVWLLEHKDTGLRKSLPDQVICPLDKSFGPRGFYRLRRCVLLPGKSTVMSSFLRQANISLGGKPCRWSRGACRFGRGWRRVEKRDHFRSGGSSRRCIYVHPIMNRWMSIRFPNARGGGVRASFGFEDGVGGKVPMRVIIQIHRATETKAKILKHQKPKKVKHKKKSQTRVLLDVSIPHKPKWYEHFFPPQKVGTTSGELELRLWTTHHGAKPFCFEFVILQPVKKAVKRTKLRLLPLPEKTRRGRR